MGDDWEGDRGGRGGRAGRQIDEGDGLKGGHISAAVRWRAYTLVLTHLKMLIPPFPVHLLAPMAPVIRLISLHEQLILPQLRRRSDIFGPLGPALPVPRFVAVSGHPSKLVPYRAGPPQPGPAAGGKCDVAVLRDRILDVLAVASPDEEGAQEEGDGDDEEEDERGQKGKEVEGAGAVAVARQATHDTRSDVLHLHSSLASAIPGGRAGRGRRRCGEEVAVAQRRARGEPGREEVAGRHADFALSGKAKGSIRELQM